MSLVDTTPRYGTSPRGDTSWQSPLDVSLIEADWHHDRSEDAAFLVITAIEGCWTLRTSTRSTEISAGDLLIARATESVAAHVVSSLDAPQLLMLRISSSATHAYAHQLLQASTSTDALRLDSTSLLGHMLKGLAAQAGSDLGDPTFDPRNERAVEHVVGLIALACARSYAPAVDPILARAKNYISAHLAEIDLSPDLVAARQNVSTRTLHRLFERENTTIGRWIREERLERCRADLSSVELRYEAVSTIGARWGFWDAAHFSRLFKQSFGVSPREYRNRAARAAVRSIPTGA